MIDANVLQMLPHLPNIDRSGLGGATSHKHEARNAMLLHSVIDESNHRGHRVREFGSDEIDGGNFSPLGN